MNAKVKPTKVVKTSPKAKAAAAKVRAALPPPVATDSDVVDVARSMASFDQELAKARSF